MKQLNINVVWNLGAFFSCIFYVASQAFGDVKSTDGTILFDRNFDGQAEMMLNSVGLAIGNGLAPSANLHVAGNSIVTKTLTVGSSSEGSSNLNIVGSFGMGFQTVSNNTLLGDNSIVFADTTSGNITLEMPLAGNVTGRIYTIKKTVLNNSLLIAGGPFDAMPELVLNSSSMLSYVSLISSGGNWHILNLSGNGSNIGTGNLVLWLKLDETSGTTAYDSSGYGNHGSLINGFTLGANSVAGVLGGGLSLDGVNDYVSCAHSSSLDITGEFSLSFWVNPTLSANNQMTGYPVLVGKDNGAGYAVVVYSSSNTYAGISGNAHGNFSVADGGQHFPPNIWYHIVYTSNSSTKNFYVNGLLSITRTNSVQPFSTTANLQIGKRWNDTEHYKGAFDEVRLYNKRLTAAEIYTLYLLGL